MIPIEKLLARFKEIKNTSKQKKQTIATIITSNNIPLDPQSISFLKRTIVIKAPPIIKTEIFLQKEKLLRLVNKELGEGAFTAIQ